MVYLKVLRKDISISSQEMLILIVKLMKLFINENLTQQQTVHEAIQFKLYCLLKEDIFLLI